VIKRLTIATLLCLSVLAGELTPPVVSAADGNQYKLIKAEKKMPNGAISIAEYVRVGDKSGNRYAMHLSVKGGKPSFWKIKG